jgi:predicted phosphodiesterase
MRLGLVGDIHAEDERLESALALFAKENVDRVLFVGDIADGLGDVDRCVRLLVGAGAIGVRGNHDRWLVADEMRTLKYAHSRNEPEPSTLAFLESLGATLEVDTPRGALLLCHGVGSNDMARLREDTFGYDLANSDELADLLRTNRYALAVGGHTHSRMIRKFSASDLNLPGDASLVFVNPGTLARDATPCAAMLDLDANVVRYYELEEPERPFASEVVPLPLAPL